VVRVGKGVFEIQVQDSCYGCGKQKECLIIKDMQKWPKTGYGILLTIICTGFGLPQYGGEHE
jgi:hypothetical protein